MKWNIRRGKFPHGTRYDEQFLFEEMDLKYKDGEPELKKELGGLGFVEWITYPIAVKPTYTPEELQAIALYDKAVRLPIPLRSEVARRKFEIFCGGFLFYHDKIFKKYPLGKGYTDENGYPEWKTYPHKNFEHKIYFEWVNEKGSANDKVTIYITETPAEFNGNPPPPQPPPPPES